ncbi:hypothetical protein B0H13DRAFT_2348788 [Mycena leptocephala]|nr:hypothetical protein B0H13DRAFT_2348788 [Mycena leptocephala]
MYIALEPRTSHVDLLHSYFHTQRHSQCFTVQYRYGTLEPLDPLPSNPDHPIFLNARDPQLHWRQYTRDVFPLFDGEQYISMGNYDDTWKEYKVALAKHKESESANEAAFMEQPQSKFSEWEKRMKEYCDRMPGLHQHQSERILLYIEEHNGVLLELEMCMNTLGCYIRYRLHAQFEDEDRALESHFPAASSRSSKKAPVCEEAAPPPLPLLIPRKRDKAMSDEPEIVVLECGSISGSDNVSLSVLRSAKGKGKSKTDAAPAPSSKKKSPVLSDDREGSEDEGGGGMSGIVTRLMKVKRGKRLVNVEMTGLQNTYNSMEWHQANDLFVFDSPLTSTGSNKIVTHAYPYDDKHPRFSRTWKHQVTLASLPPHSFCTRGKGCVRCSLAESDCVCLRYGDDMPTGVCMHCRADNVTCKGSPVEFDWEMLPDINTEFLELQLTLMLEIAEQVGGTGTMEHLLTRFMHHLCIMGTDKDVLQTRRAIFGSIDSSPATGKFQFHPNPMLREEGDNLTNNSETEVEVGKGEGSMDVLMDGAAGAVNEGPPLTSSTSASDPIAGSSSLGKTGQ